MFYRSHTPAPPLAKDVTAFAWDRVFFPRPPSEA